MKTEVAFTLVDLRLIAIGLRKQLNNLGDSSVQTKNEVSLTLAKILKAITKLESKSPKIGEE